jgi:hypothetical protein
VLKWLGQEIHVVNSIIWTRQVADALKGGLSAVAHLEKKLTQQIKNIVNFVDGTRKPAKKKARKKPAKAKTPSGKDREDDVETGEEEAEEAEKDEKEKKDAPKTLHLSEGDRRLLATLLTISVHSRDSVTHLLEAHADADSFEGTNQLR